MEIIFGIAAVAFFIGLGIGSVFGFYVGESTHKPNVIGKEG